MYAGGLIRWKIGTDRKIAKLASIDTVIVSVFSLFFVAGL